MNLEDLEEYVREIKAAEFLDSSQQTLANWRCRGVGPPYVKMGRSIRYSKKDLIAFMTARRIKTRDSI